MRTPTGTLIAVDSTRKVSSVQWMAAYGTPRWEEFQRPEAALQTLHNMKVAEPVRFAVDESTYDALVPLIENFYKVKREFRKRREQGALIITRVL